jgi:hypothetical protein
MNRAIDKPTVLSHNSASRCKCHQIIRFGQSPPSDTTMSARPTIYPSKGGPSNKGSMMIDLGDIFMDEDSVANVGGCANAESTTATTTPVNHLQQPTAAVMKKSVVVPPGDGATTSFVPLKEELFDHGADPNVVDSKRNEDPMGNRGTGKGMMRRSTAGDHN